MTPLNRAAACGHLQIVEVLLSNGAEVDSKDKVSTYIYVCIQTYDI